MSVSLGRERACVCVCLCCLLFTQTRVSFVLSAARSHLVDGSGVEPEALVANEPGAVLCLAQLVCGGPLAEAEAQAEQGPPPRTCARTTRRPPRRQAALCGGKGGMGERLRCDGRVIQTVNSLWSMTYGVSERPVESIFYYFAFLHALACPVVSLQSPLRRSIHHYKRRVHALSLEGRHDALRHASGCLLLDRWSLLCDQSHNQPSSSHMYVSTATTENFFQSTERVRASEHFSL